jgi:MFS family permease
VSIGIYRLGSGLVLSSLINMALKSVPGHFAGTAAGVYNTFQHASTSLGTSIVGGIFYHVIDAHRYPNMYSTAFHYGMIAEIACFFIVRFLLYALPNAKSGNHEAFSID